MSFQLVDYSCCGKTFYGLKNYRIHWSLCHDETRPKRKTTLPVRYRDGVTLSGASIEYDRDYIPDGADDEECHQSSNYHENAVEKALSTHLPTTKGFFYCSPASLHFTHAFKSTRI